MSSKSRMLLLVFALIGLAAASVSSYVHYQLLTQPAYDSFCDVNSSVNCAQAYLSPYGSFLGVPVALGGVIFFAIVAVLAGVAAGPGSSARETAPAYIFVLSTIGLAFVLYLAWGSYMVLGVFCILCAITYVSVIALFVISGGATTFPMTTLPGRATRDLKTLVSSPAAIALFLALTVGSAVLIAKFPNEAAAQQAQAQAVATFQPLTEAQMADLKRWWDVQPIADLPVQPSAGTKVLIVKFSDYQCPGCRAAHDAVKPVLAKYQGQPVEFVMKHYPLEPECNPTSGGNHFASCEAAAAYEMARGNPKQAELDDWLFANQASLNRDVVKSAAADIAGITDYDARYETAIQAVKEHAGLGGQMKIRSTPTFFVNGRRIDSGIAPAALDGLIQIILNEGTR
jgi:uncharacterized membrane protein/protein-disulfide isomerase